MVSCRQLLRFIKTAEFAATLYSLYRPLLPGVSQGVMLVTVPMTITSEMSTGNSGSAWASTIVTRGGLLGDQRSSSDGEFCTSGAKMLFRAARTSGGT